MKKVNKLKLEGTSRTIKAQEGMSIHPKDGMVEVIIPHTKEPVLNDISEFNLEKNDLSTSAFLLTA